MAFDVSFKLDWKLLGAYVACLGVLLFAVLVFRNHQVVSVQKAELDRLEEVKRQISWERRSLEARRDSLARREPYFYEMSLREEWGYRRPGEVLMSELPSQHYVTKGISLSEISEEELANGIDLERVLMFTLLGIAIAIFTFLSLFPIGVKEEEKPDPQVEIGKADTQRLRKSEHLND